ncbi:hypothetical protein Agub_g8685 [Astrephomene gubernaculifera]|uniref:Uncharacterized protein n=1 Tax=Astrephomene gubernaculifera TaxID=47775 RepID=A0AAD3HN98_9CHLO|nr:hypothetical protein Agub_g8685 [Astrephomene gubernaculifera]
MASTLVQMDGLNEMDANQYTDIAASEACAHEDIPAGEDVEYAPVAPMHPLAVATRQLEILQHHLFLAGSAGSVQTHSNDECQPASSNDTGPYCRLACDVLSCAVSACELWRDSLLQHGPLPAANPTQELSTMELSRLMSSLLASMHILDCLKDTKQSLRTALMSVTAQEGDEQQLLVAVQDFFGMPAACVVLLRDLLLEDASTLTSAKHALLGLLQRQLVTVETLHASQDSATAAGDRSGTVKRSSFKSKLGLSSGSGHGGAGAAGAGLGGAGSGASIAARSGARIGLSLLVYLYCCVDTAEQEQQATVNAQTGGAAADTATSKAAAAATYKILRSCVSVLRSTPVVPGYGDVPVDLLRPLQGLSQLTCGPPWESGVGGSMYLHAAAAEERYNLSSVSVAAARDYGRLVEDLLSLKLQHEALTSSSSASSANNSSNRPASNPATPTAVAAVVPASKNPNSQPATHGSGSTQAITQAAGGLAGRAVQLLQDWQAAVLLLDAFRTWQRQQRLQRLEEERAAMGGEERAQSTGGSDVASSTLMGPLPRSAFTATDLPDVVRMVSYIKGLYGILNDNMTWLEPLLKAHCVSHLRQLATSVMVPVSVVAQGVAGGEAAGAKASATGGMTAAAAAAMLADHRFASQQQLMPPHQQQQYARALGPQSAREAYPTSAPSSARAIAPGLAFGTSHSNNNNNSTGLHPLSGPLQSASPRVGSASGDVNSLDAITTTNNSGNHHHPHNTALGLGRIWKGKASSHGRHHSTITAAVASGANNNTATQDVLGLGLRPPPVSAPPAVAFALPAESALTGTMMSQRTTEDSADTCNLIASITADAADWPPSKSPADVRTTNDPYTRLREWFANGNQQSGNDIEVDRNAPLQAVPEGPTPRSDVAATSASMSHRMQGGSGGAGAVGGDALSPSVHHHGSCSPSGGCMSGTLPKSRDMQAMLLNTGGGACTEVTEDGVECTVSSVSDTANGMGGLDISARDATLDGHEDEEELYRQHEEDEEEGDVTEDQERAEGGRGMAAAGGSTMKSGLARVSREQPGSASKRRWAGSVTGSEINWPEMPLASWLAGSNTTTPKAGANAGSVTQAAAVLARVTPPAAISTNPLYVYPSAAEEAVAEQERATVAILIASEGGSMGTALTGADQAALAVAAASTAAPPSMNGDNVDGHQTPSVYMDEMGCSIDMGAGGMHQFYPAVPDQHLIQQQQQQQEQSHVQMYGLEGGSPVAGDLGNGVSAQLEPAGALAATTDHLMQPDVMMNNAAAAVAAPQPVSSADVIQQQQQPADGKQKRSSTFSRFKKLFGKRDKASSGTAMQQQQPSAGVHGATNAATLDDTANHDLGLDALYGTEYPSALVGGGFGILPATYLAFQPDLAPSLGAAPPMGGAADHAALPFMMPGMLPSLYTAPASPGAAFHNHHPGLHGATHAQLPAGFRQSMASSDWAGLVSEAAAHDGAIAMVSVEPAVDLPATAPFVHQALQSQGSVGEPEPELTLMAGTALDSEHQQQQHQHSASLSMSLPQQMQSARTPRAGDVAGEATLAGGVAAMGPAAGPTGGKVGGGLGGLLGGGAAAFLDVVCKAREQNSCMRLKQLASEMQVCLVSAGFTSGLEAAAAAGVPGSQAHGAPGAAGRKGGFGAISRKAGLKRLVVSLKGKSGGRASSDTGGSDAAAGQALEAAWDAAGSEFVGLDRQGAARLRNVAELMANEIEKMVGNRRSRGKSTKDGPSLVQLLALFAEIRSFLNSDLPSLEPLLAFRSHLASASDLSALLLLDPSRPYAGSVDGRLAADSRGSVPWELASKGVLGQGLGQGQGQLQVAGAAAASKAPELPLTAALTALALFHDVTEAVQAQQASCTASGYPEPPMAERMVLLFRRQARWCLNNLVHSAARSVWATFKAQAIRWELGMQVPSGAADVAPSTAALQGFFQHAREDSAVLQLQQLTGYGTEPRLPPELSITDMLSAAVEDLVRQAACRTASLLLGSDMTALVAVKQQLDVLSLAVSRLRRDLPNIRPWSDTWLAALAARAASAPTCTAIAEAAAATAASVVQGCGINGAGVHVTVEEILLTHVCSPGVLRALSMWSYDMIAVRFRHTKHTKSYWDGLTGVANKAEAAVHHRDGADATLESAAAAVMAAAGLLGPSSSSRRGSKDGGRSSSGGSGAGAAGPLEWPEFGREHVVAMHGLLGLSGVGRWVAALRRHASELLSDAAPLLRRVHELYDSSVAGPRGPGLRGTGGASGYLQLQQRWLRDRGHSEMLVSANRALQALGNTVAVVALTDSVLAELCVGRVPHLLPLTATAMQADQQAHSVLKAMAQSEPVNPMLGKSSGAQNAASVPPPPPGTGLAGMLLGQPLPPGLVSAEQPAVQAAALVQERLQEQLPPTFGLPGLWRALHEVIHPAAAAAEISSSSSLTSLSRTQQQQQQSRQQQQQLLLQEQQPFSSDRLWSVLQVQLSCLSSEEQSVHAANVGDGVYVSAAAMVQLAAGAAVAPGSVLPGDTMTILQQAAALEELKAELAAATGSSGGALAAATPAQAAAAATAQATLEQLKMWAARAQSVRAAWDRAVQLTVGAGTAAAKLAAERRANRSEPAKRALELPPLTTRTAVPWVTLSQQMAAVGAALLMRVAAAAAAAPQQQQQAPQAPRSGTLHPPSMGVGLGGAGSGSRLHAAPPLGRPSSQIGQPLPSAPQGRNAPPRPPQPQQHQAPGASATPTPVNPSAPAAPGGSSAAASAAAAQQRSSVNGPVPLVRTGSGSGPNSFSGPISTAPAPAAAPATAAPAPAAAAPVGAAPTAPAAASQGPVAAAAPASGSSRRSAGVPDAMTLQQQQQQQQRQQPLQQQQPQPQQQHPTPQHPPHPNPQQTHPQQQHQALQPHQQPLHPHQQTLQQLRAASQVLLKASPRAEGGAPGVPMVATTGPYGAYGTFGVVPAGSTAAQSRSHAGSSLAEWGHME